MGDFGQKGQSPMPHAAQITAGLSQKAAFDSYGDMATSCYSCWSAISWEALGDLSLPQFPLDHKAINLLMLLPH